MAGHKRESFFLSTKFYEAAKRPIDQVFEEQLQRLQTDYIDFYLLHSLDENYIDAYTDPKKDYIGYLLRQKEMGKIRYIGFSSHAAPETLRRFLNWYDQFDMALIQLNYLDWTLMDAKSQYEILSERGIPVWVMEPMKGGILSVLNDEASAILKEAAPERSVSSWGFRFLMGLPGVQTVLSGMSDLDQLEENLATFSRSDPLSADEEKVLHRAAETFLSRHGVLCSGCRYCCAACPAGLDIPLLIRGYNEWKLSGETWRIASLDYVKKPEECLQCGTCLEHCPQKINIPEILRDFAALG